MVPNISDSGVRILPHSILHDWWHHITCSVYFFYF